MKKIKKLLAEYEIRFHDTDEILESSAFNCKDLVNKRDYSIQINENRISNENGVVYKGGKWSTAKLTKKPETWVVEKDENHPMWKRFKEWIGEAPSYEDCDYVGQSIFGQNTFADNIFYFEGYQYLTLDQWAEFYLPKIIMKMKITEEMKVHEQWYKIAEDQTLETLPEFLKMLTEDYQHDYGTICHAMAAGAIAAAAAINHSDTGGITGFQAGAVMWGFIKNWLYSDNKVGLGLVNYDNLLFPQYEDRFKNTISERQWKILRETAAKKITEDSENTHPKVLQHWKNIIEGMVPFGFKIKIN